MKPDFGSPDNELWFANLVYAAKQESEDEQAAAFDEATRAVQVFAHVLISMTDGKDSLVAEDAAKLMRTLVERGVETLWGLEIND